MLLLAHTGIPLGTIWLLHHAARRAAFRRATPLPQAAGNPHSHSEDKHQPLSRSAATLDYRLVLLGSMLPDIDKPLGIWLLRDSLGSGRAVGHTLLFAFLLVTAGLLLYARGRTWHLLSLALGSTFHLALDEMWLSPRTLFWPLYGWGFERTDVSHWLEMLLTSLGTKPRVYVPEIIGALLLAAILWRMAGQGGWHSFLRIGKID